MNTRLPGSEVLFVCLPPEPQLRPELVQLRETVARAEDRHLILDLACIEIITSPSIGSLLLLRRQLSQRGRRLILCNCRLATKCIFRVAGLDAFFEFAADKVCALESLRHPVLPTVENTNTDR